MQRTITVKGVGTVSAKPDLIVVTITLRNLDMDYERALDLSAKDIAAINGALTKIGFKKGDLKTTSFDVDTCYSSVKDGKGLYKEVFDGYMCKQNLKLEFHLDIQKLGKVLSAIASCKANPELSIAFTVKNPSAINAALLRSATENARQKANVLCESAGVRRGALLSIDYNWGEVSLYSATRYSVTDGIMPMMKETAISDIEFEPDEIHASDTATFVWEID